MYISEIRLKNFKKFKDATFSFDHKINIVKGENEEGKSTLLSAISAALYIDPSSRKYVDIYKPWNQSTSARIELDFFINSVLYAISKDFNTKEVILKNVIEGSEEQNLAIVEKKIKEFTGIGSEGLFYATACIRHDEVSKIDAGKKSLGQALQEISLQNTGGADVLGLLETLKNKVDEMQVGLFHPAKHDGVIKKLSDEVAEKTEELTELEARADGGSKSSDKLLSLKKELEQVNSQIEKYTKIITVYEQKDSIEKELTMLQEKIKGFSMDLDKISQIRERGKVAEVKINVLGGMPALKQIEDNHAAVIALNKEMQDAQKLLQEAMIRAQDIPEIVPDNPYIGWIVAGAALTVLLIGIGIFVALPLIAVGLVIGAIDAVFLYKKISAADDEKIEINVNANWQPLQEKLDILKERQVKLLKAAGVTSVEDFFTKRTQLIALEADITQMHETVTAVLRGKDIVQVETELRDASARGKELQVQLPSGETVNADEYTRDKRELELLKLDEKDITKEMMEEQAQEKVGHIEPAQLATKQKTLSDLKDALAEQKRHVEVLQIIYTALQSAKDEISTDVSAGIQQYTDKSLPAITDGRYSTLKIDTDFKVSVHSKEKNEWINPQQHLSKGTVDQIYLSVRLALADMLTEGKSTPFFFDDAFLTFDETRRLALMEVLKYISEQHQVFIFTCHDFFDIYGKVISVGGNNEI